MSILFFLLINTTEKMMVNFKATFEGFDTHSKQMDFEITNVQPNTVGAQMEAEKIISTMILTRTLLPVRDTNGDQYVKVITGQMKFSVMRQGDHAIFEKDKLVGIITKLSKEESEYATSENIYGYIKNTGMNLEFTPADGFNNEFIGLVDLFTIKPSSIKGTLHFEITTNEDEVFELTTKTGFNKLIISDKNIRVE
ncbi:hypothetical protein [Proteus mirabilis]|uniref:hypothetical protein n=1 Tax=Proteus mirabilis TaxID=584 RepID=UPI0034D5D2A1